MEDKIRDIKGDIEFVNNQIAYLETYLGKIERELPKVKKFNKKWRGLAKREVFYDEIDRWVKCQNTLVKHLKQKDLNDQDLMGVMGRLKPTVFKPPTTTIEDGLKGAKRFFYQAFPPYRINYNKKKIKALFQFIKSLKEEIALVKSLNYKIEAYYFDGL